MRTRATAGLLLAILAEVCSIGLLGLSGWFIAASAVASTTFSYLAPSGGVRAFALGRMATGYASRVLLHAAALRRITAARLTVYDRAAQSERPGWSGQSLDRIMADADTTGMALIQATAPVLVTAVVTAGGCLTIALVGLPVVALVLAAGVIACVLLAVASARRTDDASRTRALLRTELVTAVDAWPEMASLGATDQLVRRTLRRLAAFEESTATTALAVGGARAVTAVALFLTVVLATPVTTLVFVALLVGGVMANAERLISTAGARVKAGQANARLGSVEEVAVPSIRATYDGSRLSVSGYQLPETPIRTAREIGFSVDTGETVVITGASGSGKTTLVTAITSALRRQAATTVTAVLADDHLFTGTIADNIRLADPTATDAGITDLLNALALTGLEPQTAVGVGGRPLSGGEQRRLHLARALVTHPNVLVIDEPTTGLDPATATRTLQVLRERLPRTALILAMHEPSSRATVSLD
jgi:ATP-binding cassette subfamily C protein CydC